LYDTRADGTVELWDPARRSLRGTIATGLSQPVAAWSRTAPVLVTVGAGGGFAIWDVHDPSHAALLARGTAPGYGANRPVLWMSPDGRSFTLGCCFNPNFINPTDIPVFSVPSGRLLHLLHLSVGWEWITMSFSPDSQTLATSVLYNTSSLSGTLTGAVVLWDVASGERKATLTLPYLPIGVAWTSNGTRLATAPFAPAVPDYSHVTGRIDFWDASTLLPIGDPLHAPGDAVLGDSIGYRLLSGSTTPVGEPIVWDLDPAHWDTTACKLAGRNLTQAEWQQYLPGRPYGATCPQWPPGPSE
jgi:WD40 repeat protein